MPAKAVCQSKLYRLTLRFRGLALLLQGDFAARLKRYFSHITNGIQTLYARHLADIRRPLDPSRSSPVNIIREDRQ